MADHLSAYIRIGGTIPRLLVDALCTAITQQKLSLEWDDPPFIPTTAQELLDACTQVDGANVLQMFDHDATWGEFVDLEKFLIEHQIGFDRCHEAKWDINARLTQFRPGAKPLDFNTSVEGYVVVPQRDVLWLRDDLHKVCDLLQKKRYERGAQQLTAALEGLAKRMAEPAAPLAALVIAAE